MLSICNRSKTTAGPWPMSRRDSYRNQQIVSYYTDIVDVERTTSSVPISTKVLLELTQPSGRCLDAAHHGMLAPDHWGCLQKTVGKKRNAAAAALFIEHEK
jgi:hypothetical protein